MIGRNPGCPVFTNVDKILENVFILPRFLGTFPFTKDWNISTAFLVYSLKIRISIFLFCSYSLIRICFEEFSSNIPIRQPSIFVHLVEHYARNMALIAWLLWLVYKRRQLNEIIMNYHLVEEIMISNGVGLRWKPNFLLLNSSIIVAVISEIVNIMEPLLEADFGEAICRLDYVFSYPAIIACVHQFVCLQTVSASIIGDLRLLSDSEIIIRLQESCLKSYQSFNSCYGIVIFLLISYLFVYIVYILNLLIQDPWGDINNWFDCTLFYIWFILAVNSVVCVVTSCWSSAQTVRYLIIYYIYPRCFNKRYV